MATQSDLAAVEPDGAAASGASGALLGVGAYDISAERYHADPCPRPSLSAHIAHLLVSKSPRHAWLAHPRLNPDYVPETNSKFDLGTAAHLLMLEGVAPFQIIDAKDWRSEPARDERREVYRLGKIPLLEHQWSTLSALVKSVRLQLSQTRDAKSAFRRGKPERVIIWREQGIWCRARIDWLLLRPRARGAIEIYDFKTVGGEGSAAPQAWSSGPLWRLGHALQAEFYRRGVEKHYGRPAVFKFVVCEVEPPHGTSIVTLSPTAQEVANYQVETAIELWARCLKRDSFPGYSGRVFSAEPPAWLAREIEGEKMQRAVDQDSNVDPFKLSVALWKP